MRSSSVSTHFGSIQQYTVYYRNIHFEPLFWTQGNFERIFPLNTQCVYDYISCHLILSIVERVKYRIKQVISFS